MDHALNPVQIRILGSLMEKSLSTPEYYPLSLNALVNACNQKSSRDPVVDYDETTVQEALDNLCAEGIVFQSNVSRVPKFEEHFSRDRQFVPRETAVLCVLLLRGPQTLGELRSRTARMYTFDSLDEVAATLDNLTEWGLAKQQERLPGHKEARYTHLLGQMPADATGSNPDNQPKDKIDQPIVAQSSETTPDTASRLDKMEQALASLGSELDELKQAFESFKKQFE